MNIDMDIREYNDLYSKLIMNLIMVKDKDIEYYDEITNFLKDADIFTDSRYEYENKIKRKTLIKFFNINKKEIGYDGNIFLNRSGEEIWLQLNELYQEVLNESDD